MSSGILIPTVRRVWCHRFETLNAESKPEYVGFRADLSALFEALYRHEEGTGVCASGVRVCLCLCGFYRFGIITFC